MFWTLHLETLVWAYAFSNVRVIPMSMIITSRVSASLTFMNREGGHGQRHRQWYGISDHAKRRRAAMVLGSYPRQLRCGEAGIGR